MKEYTFGVWCSFGKGDSGETFIDVELSDEEAELLEHWGTQSEVFYDGFSRCEELSELYDKLYKIAVEQVTDELRDFGDWVDEEDKANPDWRADDLYSIGVNFPDEFEERLDDEEE